MTTQNPILARLTRSIDQARVRRLARAAQVTTETLTIIAIGATLIVFGLAGKALLPLLWIFPLVLLAELALQVLAAVVAAGITHREISGESGDTLWVTPLESKVIAEGFLLGALQTMEWLHMFAQAMAPTLGVAVSVVFMLSFFALGSPLSGPAGLRQPSTTQVVYILGFTLMILIVAGFPAFLVIRRVFKEVFRLAVRVGVTTAFWLRTRDAGSVRAVSGAILVGFILAMLLSCAASLWLPAMISNNVMDGLSMSLWAGLLLLLFAPLAFNEWLKWSLLRSIDRSRSRH